jgi:hypothetical protein
MKSTVVARIDTLSPPLSFPPSLYSTALVLDPGDPTCTEGRESYTPESVKDATVRPNLQGEDPTSTARSSDHAAWLRNGEERQGSGPTCKRLVAEINWAGAR